MYTHTHPTPTHTSPIPPPQNQTPQAELEASVLTPTSLYDGRLDLLQRMGLAPLAWGPLGGDPLAGVNRLYNFAGDRQLRILKALDEVAKELGPGMCGGGGMYESYVFGFWSHTVAPATTPNTHTQPPNTKSTRKT